MRITRLEIENYRSIRHLEIYPAQLSPLVGHNNAGKSNILSALDLVLGPRFPTDASLSEADFYGFDEALSPRVAIDISYVDEGGYDAEIQFEFGEDNGQLRLRYTGDGQTNKWANRLTRERFPFIRLGMERAARQQQPTNRWTLLGRLLLEINQRLKSDPDRMDRFTKTMAALRDEVLESGEGFRELRDILRTESARQIQRTVDDVDVDFALHDPWNFYRTLQLVVTEDGLRLRAEQMGMGLQSSLAIALLRAYALVAKDNHAIIAIEEPELFLHPIAARQFYALMRDLAYPATGPGLQILYTTHSGLMVDIEHFDELIVVRRVPRQGTTAVQASVDAVVAEIQAGGVADATPSSLKARIRATFDRSRTDGLFASAIILVEGQSEELSLPVYASAIGIELDRLNIAVVSAGSKTAMPLLMRIFSKLDIPVYPIFDLDGHLPDERAKRAINEEILSLVGAGPPDPEIATAVTDQYACWAEDYERMLRSEVADYSELEETAGEQLGGAGKGVRARFCALELAERGDVPGPVSDAIARAVRLVAA